MRWRSLPVSGATTTAAARARAARVPPRGPGPISPTADASKPLPKSAAAITEALACEADAGPDGGSTNDDGASSDSEGVRGWSSSSESVQPGRSGSPSARSPL